MFGGPNTRLADNPPVDTGRSQLSILPGLGQNVQMSGRSSGGLSAYETGQSERSDF